MNRSSRTQITNVTVKGAWIGPARLQFFEHALAPFADLPVRDITILFPPPRSDTILDWDR
jgi:acetoacetate decarboxylase